MMNILKKLQNTLYLTLFILGVLVAFSIPTQAEVGDTPHWSYGGAANPTQWGRLGHDFAVCEEGKDQSPIDINNDNTIAVGRAEIEFNYISAPLVVQNNGHTVQVNYAEGSTISIDGEEYELLQFHFHTPSEHTTSGQAYAMELHFVHRNAAGELAVIGVMMEAGTEHSAISTIWEHIPEEENISVVEGSTINAAELLPSSTAYFSYAGSLTTPPCSEGVRWYVLAEPIQVSEEQIAGFERYYQVNARPVQPTNGRIIRLYSE